MHPLTPLEIARREERRKAVAIAAIADEAEAVMGGWMGASGAGSWTNQACAVGLEGPVDRSEVDRLVAFYASRGIEPRMALCPYADESLVRELARLGFTLREFDSVFSLPLRASSALDCLPESLPEGVEIRVVDRDDPSSVEVFLDASCRGCFEPGQAPPAGFIESARRAVRFPDSTSFLALLDGRPVGGGGLEVAHTREGERIACLYGASVLHDARRRGVQQALIAARVRFAHQSGAGVATIASRPGGPTERNAHRLGFRAAYTTAVLALQGEGLTPSP